MSRVDTDWLVIPISRVFCKRARKLLKTNGSDRKKSGKREKECANERKERR